MNPANYRWMLLRDLVDNFNEYRGSNFSLSDLLCADESISRWYGQGGHWINLGLPMYVAIDRKPENGCEIQNLADARAYVMLQLKLVEHEENENQYLAGLANGQEQGGPINLGHGTNVIKKLRHP